MGRTSALVASLLLLAACSSSGGGAGGGDSRVMSLRGHTAPELTSDVRWLNAPPSTLAALRGRVVYLQFAFPT